MQGKVKEQKFGGLQEKKRISKTKTGWKTESVSSFQTPEGRRFYSGTGQPRDLQMSADKAKMQARIKAASNPADSVTTDYYKKFKTK